MGAAADERARHLLEALIERQPHRGAAIGQQPGAADHGGDDPQIDVAPADDAVLVGLPVAHRKCVGDEARAGAQLGQQARPEPEVDRRQQIGGDHARLADRRVENVLAAEAGPRFDAGEPSGGIAFGHARRIDVDAKRAGATLRRRDHDPAVARAQVDQRVARRQRGEIEHRLHHRPRRRHIRHVEVRLGRRDRRRVERCQAPALEGAGTKRQCGEGKCKSRHSGVRIVV